MKKVFLTAIFGLMFMAFDYGVLQDIPKSLHKTLQKEWGIEHPHFSCLLNSGSDSSANQGFYCFSEKNNAAINGYLFLGRVHTCRAGGCSISEENVERGQFEYFNYYILFDTAAQVTQVSVFDYAATHGYEITAKSWLKQFIGHRSGEPLYVGKQVDAIAGATISTHAIARDIQLRTEELEELRLEK